MTKQPTTEELPDGIELLDNGRYKLDVYVLDPRTNKRKRKRKTCPKQTTLEQAVALRDALIREIQGEPQPKPSRQTVAGYAAKWIERKAPRLKPATERLYRSILDDRVIPVLGTLYADAVIRADVEEWVIWAEEQETPRGKPYADATLARWWTCLGVLLKDMAADIGIADPTARIERPKSSRKNIREARTLTLEQLGELLEVMRKDFADWYTETLVMAYTGIRAGELYALHWEDVEDDHLIIRRGVSDGEITDTKTHAERVVYLPPLVSEAIKEHRLDMIARQHRGLSSGLVFPNSQGGVRRQWAIRKPLTTAKEMAGIEQKVTPQVLRRTYNTLLVQAGVDRIVLRSQIGHSTERMTELYSGVSLDAKKAAHTKVFSIGGVTSPSDTPKEGGSKK